VVVRDGLPPSLWHSQSHRIFKQDIIGSNQASVSVVRHVLFHHDSQSHHSRLPELAGELQKLLKETEAQINKLPAAPSDDAQGEVLLLISDFARELAAYVEGTPDDNGIHQTIRPLNQTFLAAIRRTAQNFFPFESRHGGGYTHPTFLPSEEEPVIYAGEEDTICVDEVMVMANK